jgi:Bacteriophage T4-like portal protein (Gp20)
LRALGVPSSYLPTGPEDGTTAVSDGRIGSAFMQEFRFSKVVTRHQQQIIEPIDMEFKLFLKRRGITIDNSLFELTFTPAQSFSEYRQLELDSAKINTFTALTEISFVSKRFILKRYLGWTEAELEENERMWKEERSRLTKTFAPGGAGGGGAGGGMGGLGGGMGGGDMGGDGEAPAGLSDVGITSSGIDDMAPGEEGEEGAPGEGGADVSDTEVDNFGS